MEKQNPSCGYYHEYKNQEQKQTNPELDGASGYRIMGCDSCDGEDRECDGYMDFSNLEIRVDTGSKHDVSLYRGDDKNA